MCSTIRPPGWIEIRKALEATLRRDPGLPVGDQRVIGEEPGELRP